MSRRILRWMLCAFSVGFSASAAGGAMIKQILIGAVFVAVGTIAAAAGEIEGMPKYTLLGAFALATLILGQFAAVAVVHGNAWAHHSAEPIAGRAPASATFVNAKLVADLRESTQYLKDANWHQTAILIAAAADEIERLSHRATRNLLQSKERP